MSDETRAALADALAAHVTVQNEAVASGQDPAGVDRTAIEDAARLYLAAADDHDTLRDEYERLRDEAAGPAAVQAAAERLTAHRQASRVLEGRPVATTIGG